ncbi:MAG: response regulator [Candidatus Solibacter sp.]
MAVGTILVVDHHREIVTFATAALSHADYHVVSARNGHDGMHIIEAHGGVDLAISEALMPGGLSGVEFVQQIRERFPATAVLLMTGFTEEAIGPDIPLLKKPFAASTLVGRVQRVLTDSRRSNDDLRHSCRKLRTQFETNLDLRPEVEAAIESSRLARGRSQRIRAEWLRSRLREADHAIPSVLVVENDALARSAICHYFESVGLTVLRASNAEVALELVRLRHGRVDTLITDINMSGMNGLELAYIMSAQFPDTTVVFATAQNIDVSQQVVRKPFEPEELLAAIAEKLLQRMQDRRA